MCSDLHLSRAFLLICVAALVGCVPQRDENLARRTNELLESHLKGRKIDVVPLKTGDAIRLPDLVSVGSSKDGECLSIAFTRADLDDRFLNDLFYPKQQNKLKQLPPFTEPGVEAILTPGHVVFNLYSGVVVHFQPSLSYPDGYAAFKSEAVTGNVVKVIGEAAHIAPGTIPDSFTAFMYVRDGRAFAYKSVETGKGMSSNQDSQVAASIDKMNLTFKPTVIKDPVSPDAVACTVKPFR